MPSKNGEVVSTLAAGEGDGVYRTNYLLLIRPLNTRKKNLRTCIADAVVGGGGGAAAVVG